MTKHDLDVFAVSVIAATIIYFGLQVLLRAFCYILADQVKGLTLMVFALLATCAFTWHLAPFAVFYVIRLHLALKDAENEAKQ